MERLLARAADVWCARWSSPPRSRRGDATAHYVAELLRARDPQLKLTGWPVRAVAPSSNTPT